MHKVSNKILFYAKYFGMGSLIALSGSMLINFRPPFSLYGNNFTALRILSATLTIAIIPGYLLFNLMQLKKRIELDPLESVVVSFGVSLAVIEAFCILSIETGLNSFKAALFMLIVTLILLIVNFFKERNIRLNCAGHTGNGIRGLDKYSLLIHSLLLIAIITTSFLLYKIGSPISSGEDQMHIAVVRKLLENPVINKTDITYEPQTVYTYLYPGLHFMFALVSRLSAIDPVIVYAKFRFILGILSLLIIWTFSKTLFKSKFVAFAISATCLTLIYNGMAGQLSLFYCGQLAPVSHISDISMDVLLPLVLVFSFKYLLSEGAFNRFFLLFILLMMTTIIVHAREGVQVLFYYFFTFAAYLVFNRNDKKMIYKIFILIFSVLLMGTAYKYIHSSNVEYVKNLEISEKRRAVNVFVDLSKDLKSAFATPENCPQVKGFVPAGRLIFKKYISFAIPVSLLMLWLFRKTFWGIFFSSSIIASVLFMRFNILAISLVILTYSEMMYVPARFMFFFSYIIFGLVVYLIVKALNSMFGYLIEHTKLARPAVWLTVAFTALSSSFILMNFNDLIQDMLYKKGTFLLLFMSLLIIFMIVTKIFAVKIKNFQDHVMASELRYKGAGLLSLFLILYPIYQYGCYENQDIFGETKAYRTENIFYEYARNLAVPDISDFKAYYKKTDIFNLPPEVVEFIRSNVEPGNKFAYNIKSESFIFIPVFANQYIAVAPDHYEFSIKNLSDDYLNLSKTGQIIFNSSESDAVRLGFIQRFNFTYLLVDPPFYHLNKAFEKYESFEKVFDSGNYTIYKIDRKLLDKAIAAGS